MRVLGISGSSRKTSHDDALLRAAQQGAPEGMEVGLYDELELIPPYSEDRDTATPPSPQRSR